MASSRTLPRLPLFEAITSHDPASIAVIHSESGRSFDYSTLVRDVASSKSKLAAQFAEGHKSMAGERIAFLVENGYDYVGAHIHPPEVFYFAPSSPMMRYKDRVPYGLDGRSKNLLTASFYGQ